MTDEEGFDLGVDLATVGLGRDLTLWLEEQGRPTEGVRVLDSFWLLPSDAPEYGMVLYRDADGDVKLWTAWQYKELWSAEHALEMLEQRADLYERKAAESRDFAARARLALGMTDDR